MSDTCREISCTCIFSFWATPLPTRWSTFNGMKINVGWIPEHDVPIRGQIATRWNTGNIDTEIAIVQDSFPMMQFVQRHFLIKQVDETRISFLADYSNEARIFMRACVIDTAFPTRRQIFALVVPERRCDSDTRCAIRLCERVCFWESADDSEQYSMYRSLG